MEIIFSKRALESFTKASLDVQKSFHKQVAFLKTDLRHPSLQAKKYDETNKIWQARVTLGWRFYFSIEKDTYYLHDIIKHPK